MAIPLGNMSSSLGAALGSGLAQPLNQGLDMLAQQKLMQLHAAQQQQQQQQQRQQYSQGLSSLLGPEVSGFISNLGPDERKYALQNLGSLMQLAQQGTQSNFGMNPMQSAAPEQGVQALLSTPQVQGIQSLLGTPQSQGAQDKTALIQDIFTSPEQKRRQQELALKEREVIGREKREAAKMGLQERKLQDAQQARIDKETLPFYEKVESAGDAAEEALVRLDNMKELINRGELPTPAFEAFFNNSPVMKDVWQALSSGDAQEFRKVSQDFVRDIKDIFPGRILQVEIENFLKTIPNLMQSDQGKAAVINNLSRFNKAALLNRNAANEIIEENDGVRPRNLKKLVRDRTEKERAQLIKDFKRDSKKYFKPEYSVFKKGSSNQVKAALGALGAGALGAAGSIGGSIATEIPKALTYRYIFGKGGKGANPVSTATELKDLINKAKGLGSTGSKIGGLGSLLGGLGTPALLGVLGGAGLGAYHALSPEAERIIQKGREISGEQNPGFMSFLR